MVTSALQGLEVAKGTVFEVQKILKKRQSEGKEPEYLIAWTGYPDQTWEKADALLPGAKEILTQFNSRKDPMAGPKPKQKRKRSS